MNGSRDHKTSTEEDQIDRIETNLAKIEEQERELALRFEIAKVGGGVLTYLCLIISLSEFFKGTIIEVLLTIAGIIIEKRRERK